MKKNVYLSVIFLMCLLPVFVQAQLLAGHAKNAVRTTVPRVKVQHPDLLHAGNSQSVIQYTDGLGMPAMTVAVGVTPSGNNLVALTANNFDGKPVEEWLPAPVSGTGVPDPDVVEQAARNFYDDNNPYTHYRYNGHIEVTPPGQDWHSNNKKSKTGYEVANMDITYPLDRINKYKMASETSVQKTGLWEEFTLDSYLTEDEEGRKTYLYYDQTDRMVLRRVMEGEITESGSSYLLDGKFYDTYYIYNDKGQLACVLPPEASKRMTNNTTYSHVGVGNNMAGSLVDMYAYLYRYDGFGRLIQSGTTQNTASHAALQNTYANTVVTESWQTGAGYTNNYLLGTNTAILTQNYYDSYDFLNRPAYASIKNDLTYAHVAGFDSIYTRLVEGVDISLRGVLTGTAVSLVGSVTGEQLTAMYYDRNGKVVQSRSNNHMGGYEKYFFRYNFSGDLLKQKHLHKVADKAEITENYEYTYDDASRPKATFHAIDNFTPIKISELEYDEVCRVKKKLLHNSEYAMNYTYNTLNQLKSITSPGFSQTLRRQNGTVKSYYDGNISEITEVFGSEMESTYRYGYDALKRLTSVKSFCAPNPEIDHAFDMNLQYDTNGNITQLTRNSWIHDYNHLDAYGYPEERVDVLDSLHFEYMGNMPWYICGSAKDEIPYWAIMKPWLKSMQSYQTCYQLAHDVNGNRRLDENRKIAWIKYNSLNLVWKVQGMNGNKTEYVYDATGAKRRTIETTPVNPIQIPLGATGTESTNIKTTNTTDYCGNFRYYNGSLKYILTPTGYIDAANASSSNWRHIYAVKDYQGNVRMELTSATLANLATTTYSLRSSMVYYPFGLKENSYSNALFQYGGNEASKDRDNSLDFHFRRLDPQLCRFTTQDPLAELDYSTSPYAYCGNDPINFIDPFGLIKGEKDDPVVLPEATVTAKRPQKGTDHYFYDPNDPFGRSSYSNDPGWDMEGSRIYDPEYEKAMAEKAALDRKLATEFEKNTEEGFNYGIPLGSVGTAISSGTEYCENKVRTSFKSGRNPVTWSKLEPNQQAWRTNRVLGKTGAQVLKYTKIAGVVGTAVSVGIAANNIATGNGRVIDYFDVGIGTASIAAALFLASNPVGWCIGVGTAIYFAGRLSYDIYGEINN